MLYSNVTLDVSGQVSGYLMHRAGMLSPSLPSHTGCVSGLCCVALQNIRTKEDKFSAPMQHWQREHPSSELLSRSR